MWEYAYALTHYHYRHYRIKKIEHIFNQFKPIGTYRKNRLSFKIKTATAEVNRIIDQALRDIPNREYYFVCKLSEALPTAAAKSTCI